MNKGVLLLYSKSDKIDYEKLAHLCEKFCSKNLDLPVHIQELSLEKTNVRTFRWAGNKEETVEWNNLDRCNAFEISPFDQTLLLDVDFFVTNNNLLNYFDGLCDFLVYDNAYDITEQNKLDDCKYMTKNNFKMLWATVCYFQKNDHVQKIFELWKNVQDNFVYYGQLFGFSFECYRNDYAMTIANHLMNGYSVENKFIGSLPSLSPLDEVVDFKKNTFVTKYQRGDKQDCVLWNSNLHIMNKKSLLETEIYDKMWSCV